MITCLGLVVGAVMSANWADVELQCAKWLQSHAYLEPRFSFEINGEQVLILTDRYKNTFLFKNVITGFMDSVTVEEV